MTEARSGVLNNEEFQLLISQDPEQMLELVKEEPQRAKNHWQSGLDFDWCAPEQDIWHILVCGMGGSGSTGDLLQAVCTNAEIPILVNKSTQLPAWVGEHTLVIGVSYSGNTAETLLALEESQRRGAALLLLSSGGKLQKWADRHQLPLLSLEGGLPPRSALFDMLFALLGVLLRWPALHLEQAELDQALDALEQCSLDWSLNPEQPVPLPFALAQDLSPYEAVFWGADTYTGLIAQRWKNQWAENAKARATWSVLPELNHNEMVAMCAGHHSRLALIYLTLEDDIQYMDQVTLELVQPQVGCVKKIHALGHNQVTKVLYLTYLGDFLSVYLALIKDEDPTPIHAIDTFKQRIALQHL